MALVTSVGTWSVDEEARFRDALDLAQEARTRVEMHDPQTHQHGVRVAQWARLMAKRLPSFDRRRLRRLEISALLHDYGKLMVPASILNKAGALDDHERALVRMHPVFGAMKAPVSPDFMEKGAILWHHKHFDGGGYPHGDVAGHRIPIEARITAVADIFDAVTSSRAYRPDGGAMPTHEGLDILRKAAGTALDPTLVSLFETIYKEARNLNGGAIGIKTLTVATVMSGEVTRARALLEREIGPFDKDDPLGGEAPAPGLVQGLMANLVHTNMDEASAANVVRYVLRMPLIETFKQSDLAMSATETRAAVRRAGNHEEAVIHVKSECYDLPYMSVVVFQGNLWLCIGEQVESRTRLSLIR